MKKFVSLALCLALALAWLPGAAAGAANGASFAGGSGTADDPYLVATAEQLDAVRNRANTHFLQINDIDLSGVAEWEPVYLSSGSVYDGGGNAVTGSTFTLPDRSYSGLFSLNYGTIQNLGLVDFRLDNMEPDEVWQTRYERCIGGIAGKNYGTIRNCYAENIDMDIRVELRCDSRDEASVEIYAGGITGYNAGLIENCYVTGSIDTYVIAINDNSLGSAVSSQDIGGIAGYNTFETVQNVGALRNCYTACSVTAEDGRADRWARGGALCGSSFSGTIEHCYCSTANALGDASSSSGAAEGILYAATDTAELAETLTEHGGSWVLGTDGDGAPRVVLAMQELAVAAEPPAGAYEMPLTVELTAPQFPSARIEYTVDGGTGRVSYSSPIQMEEDMTLLVYGVHPEDPESYRVQLLRYQDAVYPVHPDPEPGLYRTPQMFTLSAQEGAEIYYTTDGSDPTAGGTRYGGGPILLDKNTTVRAVAKVNGAFGVPQTFVYQISPEITASQPEGRHDRPFALELKSSLAPYTVYYTLDGRSDPRESGTKYTGPIEICKTTTVRAAAEYGGEWSEVAVFRYELPEPVVTPSVGPGEHGDVVRLTLSCDVSYAEVSYRVSGLAGEETAYEPGDVIEIYKSADVTVYTRYNSQLIGQTVLSYRLPEPGIDVTPAAGSYGQYLEIGLESSVPSYELYYTLDGGDPAVYGTRYTGPFELDHSATVTACALYGGEELARTSARYELDLPTVTASPAPEEAEAPVDVTLACSNAFYQIYYTTDGSDPRTSQTRTLYDGAPIHIEYPRLVVIRAVPEYGGFYGAAAEFHYGFDGQTVRVEKDSQRKYVDYELEVKLTNTLGQERTVDLFTAAYHGGAMLGIAAEQVTLGRHAGDEAVSLRYPSKELLPEDAVIKVFCLDAETREPYGQALEYAMSEFWKVQELDYLTSDPASITAQVGEKMPLPEVTAHFMNGGGERAIEPYILSNGSAIAAIEPCDLSGDGQEEDVLSFRSAGETTLSIAYTWSGVTKRLEVPVTVTEAVTVTEENGGFLADPEADPLPGGAIPISTAEDLAALGEGGTAGKTYYLENDIQLTGAWDPIDSFQGILDGGGHTIRGLYVPEDGYHQRAGLFASTSGAVIKNLAVEVDAQGVTAYYLSADDFTYSGALVGQASDSTFLNCYSTGGPVTAQGGATYAGGLVGYLYSTAPQQVTNCFSTCGVRSEANLVTGSNTCMAGGLIGRVLGGETVSVSRCYATGGVEADSTVKSPNSAVGLCAGGLIGRMNQVEMADCFALGRTSCQQGINSSAPPFSGGLTACAENCTIQSCYAAGDVSVWGMGNARAYAGGLVGSLSQTGVASGSCCRVGQIVDNTYIDTSFRTEGREVAYDQRGLESSYPGFDFTNTWTFTEGAFRGLPHLQYQE